MRVIGALHFLPLEGYTDYPGYEIVRDAALKDLQALQEGGVDAIIIENNYNLPHNIYETSEALAMFSKLAHELAERASVPLGISVLWNDVAAALTIAENIGAEFIRVPVFVDSVETSFGQIEAEPEKVIEMRGITPVKIYADVQVKHAKMLNPRSLRESVIAAQEHGADAIIITGKWTGDPPTKMDLLDAKAVVDVPIIIGSGASVENIHDLPADEVIVSTSLKDDIIGHERNVKPFTVRVKKEKVRKFVEAAKK